ncbi:Na/Pi cotransporter family protein [Acetivibrio thermocellus]|uniref:Na/Pi cotransporter family protein n=1 Tax=Acetivibrio thermocellus TaxID=1515 RepID=UPI0010A67C76|nr:Na/Pi cotransporter family protein [Acetivibrio thermocellus]THJ79534.1 Na/Pi cotransporter family protein [Acetivibrio thermocellus]
MDLFGFLELIGGLSLFLFGMSLMGTGVEKSAGNKLKVLLERLTSKKLNGFLMGLAVTAIIQSSSATTVMVVGFVNSGIMTLKQAIHVIMGANVGTTVTAWILSLAGIEGSNLFLKLLKPSSFTPVLALVGIIYYLFIKNERKKDIGLILLGFATLIYGMEGMSAAVRPLGEMEEFRNILLIFSNPVLGVLLGAIVTGIIQSSSASVGILQALSATGQVTMGTAIPIIMGQNIGTCVTALISSVGTNKNARRAAMVHLYFNLIGTVVFLTLFTVLDSLFNFAFLDWPSNHFFIAVVHSLFNILCTAMLLPFSGLLEKLAYKTIKEDDKKDKVSLLDPRLFSTPAIAINRSREIAREMAYASVDAIKKAVALVNNYDEKEAQKVRDAEQQTDKYEDALGTYLVRLSSQNLSARDTTEAAKLLFLIGEFERIADYALNIVDSAQEMYDKKMQFSESAKKELGVMMSAVQEVVETAVRAFDGNDVLLAAKVDPLEEVIDGLKSTLKKKHIERLQCNKCTIEMGFVFSDLITALERISDHCSNIAGCLIEMSHDSLNMHSYLYKLKHEPNDEFLRQFNEYSAKYAIDGN